MTTKTDQIIRQVLGQMADEAPPAHKSDGLAQPTVRLGKPALKPSLGGRLAAFGAAAIVIVVLVGAVLTIRDQPDGTVPVAATAEELEAALAAGFETLESAEGVVGTQEAYIEGYLSAKVWFTARPNGDTFVIQQADIDVRDTAWWNVASTPPATGEQIATSAWLTSGSTVYTVGWPAHEELVWRVSEAGPSGPMAFGLLFLDPDYSSDFRAQLVPPDAEITRQATTNGGSIWTVTVDDGGHSRFHIHPDGHLSSWSGQGIAPPSLNSIPIDSIELTYSPLSDPEPIQRPTPGAPFDVTDFGFVDAPFTPVEP